MRRSHPRSPTPRGTPSGSRRLVLMARTCVRCGVGIRPVDAARTRTWQTGSVDRDDPRMLSGCGRSPCVSTSPRRSVSSRTCQENARRRAAAEDSAGCRTNADAPAARRRDPTLVAARAHAVSAYAVGASRRDPGRASSYRSKAGIRVRVGDRPSDTASFRLPTCVAGLERIGRAAVGASAPCSSPTSSATPR